MKLSTCFSLFLLFCCIKSADALSSQCGRGKKVIFYKSTAAVDRKIRSGFSDEFFYALNAPLKEIGYCPLRLDSYTHRDSLGMLTPLLLIDVKENLNRSDSESTLIFVIYFLPLKEVRYNYSVPHNANQLISLLFDPEELSTFETVAVRKTVENLRTQYICHLRLESEPSGVMISSSIGLEGKTPLEWVLPVGELEITGNLNGYSELERNLRLGSPGIHTYVLEMKSRQFYNSRFMIPTIIFSVSSAILFGVERYYYSQYMDLNKQTLFNNPGQFEDLYNKAKSFEYAAFSSLALTGISFTCTFFF
ncbi:MAG: hypothetical protein JW915_06765 [Chitinispirillaceae bacterium]|nr:hypothetical protein [Chitinispirillaceae bacterium]